MKNRIIKFIKRQWLLVWIVSVSLALCSIIAYAEYPGTNNYIKRVTLFDDSSDSMFSSNLLTLIDNNKISYQPYYVGQLDENAVATTYDVDVFVWNYDIDGSGDYYKRTIEYDLDISVVDNQGNTISSLEAGKYIQVVKNDSSSALVTFNSSSSSYEYSSSQVETLATNARSQNKYTIKFSKTWNLKNDANKRVMIKATPTSDFPDLKPLAAAIGLKEEQGSSSTGWKYYINEQRLNSSALPSAYDAYNLVLTGTGSETIQIEWDPTKIALNKDFYEPNGAFPFVSGEVAYTQGGGTTTGWDKLVINADSYSSTKEYRNRYDIQLYKVNGEISSSWNFISDTVSSGIYLKINIPTDSES
ncbi:hypothetical protein SAMN02910317_02068 [Ruminococcaceae bacterium FB2012]|nr:hypothetical protein SAMN02910317_02068 [Ruminococcaceae bacterium FB2012]